MPDLQEARERLNQARTQKEQARIALFQAEERARQLALARDQAARAVGPENAEANARLEKLEGELAEAKTAAGQARESYAQFRGMEAGAFDAFEPFSDPREGVQAFSDQAPFLLLPVRIETRFKTLTRPGFPPQYELWVRVYPDDIAVDSFEEALSKNEVEAARDFWVGFIKAGGIEEQQRSAWRGLVQSFGSGRAAYIIQQYRPTNLAGQPAKAALDDVILVIPAGTPLDAAEAAPLADYWKAVWRAAGDKAKVEAARGGLDSAVGAGRAAVLTDTYVPANFTDHPPLPLVPGDVTVSVTYALFPPVEPGQVKRNSWSQAARVNVLPDRFVFLGYSGGTQTLFALGAPVPSPLAVSPDPSAAPDNQLRQENGDLIVPDDIRWMTDFDRAVAVGMGVRIPLTPAQAASGFDRFFVLGARLSAGDTQGQQMLEDLMRHHQYGRNGFSLVAQGTPTNNTEKEGSGFTRGEDADASFDVYMREAEPFPVTGDPRLQTDGQRLAEALGIGVESLSQVPGARGTDGAEAAAMNTALWPATLGYWMETMLAPVFSDEAVEATHDFFTRFVSGRGALPALRVGSTPYGILPTAALSKVNWYRQDSIYSSHLHRILTSAGADWAALARQVSYVGKAGDAHQILLDILGLHPGSVEYHQRYAESVVHLFNLYNLTGKGAGFAQALDAMGLERDALSLLRRLGYAGEATPALLKVVFSDGQHLLKGPVVDDRPLSEITPIRPYTPDSRNYIRWLADAARASLETLRMEQGFKDNKPPAALLYLFLRHALLQSYWGTSIKLHLESQVIDREGVAKARREPDFIHVRQGNRGEPAQTESRWKHLVEPEPRITGSANQKIADFITTQIGSSTAAQSLAETLDALEKLADLPTARLERLFAEHIDLCAYRLDAWQLGLVNRQLARMRSGRRESARAGIYLGAYGWLEDLRPEAKVLTPITLPERLDGLFNKPGDAPLMQDPSNGGYIHTPSLNQAVTAAVLRSGYLADSSPANPESLSVNLSSERVRTALAILEGIRGGQSLGALLGYQFERGLHDRHGMAEVDKFIFDLRREFPLASGQLQDTASPPGTAIEAVEARNVIDGLALVEHIKASGNGTYPFGRPLPPASPAERQAIQLEVERLLDAADAVADLGIAESVHQALQNNYDRAGAVLDTYSKASYPPEPSVIQTPRTGVGLTHRVGLHLRSGLDPQVSPIPGISVSPRSTADPAVNHWLAGVLPAPDGVQCKICYVDLPGTGTVEQPVSLKDLEAQPIDLLYLLDLEAQPAMTELDDRILRYVRTTFNPRPDAAVEIHYMEAESGRISFFELSPLVAHLRRLVLQSRPLKPSDLSPGSEASAGMDEAVSADPGRVTAVQTAMSALKGDLAGFAAPLEALLADKVTNRAAILAGIDTDIDDLADLMFRAGRFGVPQTGWGRLYDWKRLTFAGLLKAVQDLVERWNDRLARFDQAMTDFGNLPTSATVDEQMALLMQAEGALLAAPLSPRPANVTDFKNTLDAKRAAFATRLGQFRALSGTNLRTVHALRDAVTALLPVSEFDTQGIDLGPVEESILKQAEDLAASARALEKELDRRLEAAQKELDAYNTAAAASKAVEALKAAAASLLGEGTPFIPEFTLGADLGSEWEQALSASQSGSLTAYLTGTLMKDFPVDEWLYGAARVREKLRALEQVTFLAEAFGTAAPALQPVQLPYVAGEPWLALDFPPDFTIPGERLLYTAHHTVPFDRTKPISGLLVDEWSEVIPGLEETTGLSFNYDRPNSEAPNAALLVLPASMDGSWHWDELVEALHWTLDLAKSRSVEPAHLDTTPYAALLPATVMAATLWQISISSNLAFNNRVEDRIEAVDNGR